MKHTAYILCLLLLKAPAIILAQGPLFELLSPNQTNIKFESHIRETESLNVLAYNLKRVMKIIGTTGLMKALTA